MVLVQDKYYGDNDTPPNPEAPLLMLHRHVFAISQEQLLRSFIDDVKELNDGRPDTFVVAPGEDVKPLTAAYIANAIILGRDRELEAFKEVLAWFDNKPDLDLDLLHMADQILERNLEMVLATRVWR